MKNVSTSFDTQLCISYIFWQCKPVHPAVQLQAPVSGSQVALLWQEHVPLQPYPKVPFLHPIVSKIELFFIVPEKQYN